MGIFDEYIRGRMVSQTEREMKRYRLSLRGRVQSCGFRYYCTVTARRFDITGWVKNERDHAVVTMEVQGPPTEIDAYLAAVMKGNGTSRVDSLDMTELELLAVEKGFRTVY